MKHELNSQNTKLMLCKTLLTLLDKKPISKITVSEIVTLCNINRKTFYYHFIDVYDLFEWHISTEIEKSISKFDPLSDLNTTITYSVNYIKQHTYLKNCISSPIAKDKLVCILNKTLYPKVDEMISILESSHQKVIEPDFKEFLAKNLTHITVLSILDSIENPNNYDAEKAKQYLSHIIDASVNGFFQHL